MVPDFCLIINGLPTILFKKNLRRILGKNTRIFIIRNAHLSSSPVTVSSRNCSLAFSISRKIAATLFSFALRITTCLGNCTPSTLNSSGMFMSTSSKIINLFLDSIEFSSLNSFTAAAMDFMINACNEILPPFRLAYFLSCSGNIKLQKSQHIATWSQSIKAVDKYSSEIWQFLNGIFSNELIGFSVKNHDLSFLIIFRHK